MGGSQSDLTSNAMLIRLILPNKMEEFITIDPERSVRELIKAIQRGYPELNSGFVLTFRGRVLESQYSLKDYGISEGSEIHVRPAIQDDEISVNFVDDERIYPLNISSHWTVDQVMKVLQRYQVHDGEIEHLNFKGCNLEKGKTVLECGLFDDCEVIVQ
ncbi:hypothetical protein Aperf_G00000104004 [Anoplocephala perfoliata]